MMRTPVFRRSPVLVLTAALVALAALFAGDARPAAGDHGEAVIVWSGTLTVQSVSTASGCLGNGASSCSHTSVLSDNDFTYEGVDYEVDQISYFDGEAFLAFSLNKNIPASLDSAWIEFDGVAIRLAGKRGTGPNADKFAIPRGGRANLAWITGQTVQISLQFQPPPSGVELSAQILAVAEGGSGTFTVALTDDPAPTSPFPSSIRSSSASTATPAPSGTRTRSPSPRTR